MDYGVLRVNETAEAEIEAAKAFVMVHAKSEKLVFGNASLTASEDLKTIIEKIKKLSETVEIETESVSTETNSGMFGKNSTAIYTVKLTVSDLDKLGAILGICSEGKKINVRSIIWDYDDEEGKLHLIKEAMRKAKHKADQMMDVINYTVVGIRSCSDSYKMPSMSEVILSASGADDVDSMQSLRMRHATSSPEVDIGTQFKSKKKVSATCTVEFLVKEKT